MTGLTEEDVTLYITNRLKWAGCALTTAYSSPLLSSVFSVQKKALAIVSAIRGKSREMRQSQCESSRTHTLHPFD